MTAIVGLMESGSVYIGGDSAGVSGMSLTVRADAKVFRRKHYLLGFTTTEDAGLSPRRRVLRALTAAERFSAGVRGPFVCLKAP